MSLAERMAAPSQQAATASWFHACSPALFSDESGGVDARKVTILTPSSGYNSSAFAAPAPHPAHSLSHCPFVLRRPYSPLGIVFEPKDNRQGRHDVSLVVERPLLLRQLQPSMEVVSVPLGPSASVDRTEAGTRLLTLSSLCVTGRLCASRSPLQR